MQVLKLNHVVDAGVGVGGHGLHVGHGHGVLRAIFKTGYLDRLSSHTVDSPCYHVVLARGRLKLFGQCEPHRFPLHWREFAMIAPLLSLVHNGNNAEKARY